MNPVERIKKVIEYTHKGAVALAVEVGLSRTRLDSMLRKNIQSMPFEVADKISRQFPTISREWLLTGEGDMLADVPPKTENIKIIATPAEVEQELLRNELKMMREELALMREEHSMMRHELSLMRQLITPDDTTISHMVAEPDIPPIPTPQSPSPSTSCSTPETKETS